MAARAGAIVVALGLGCAPCAWADNGIDWPALSSTVLRTVAQARDLPTPIIPLAFAEDRAGFLWAGGEAGLMRWDGYQFRTYTTGGGRQDGLRNHYFWALHVDRDGRLWAGTASGGLARYNPAADRFETVVLADRDGEATCVWSLDDDGAGGLWVGTNRGVAHLDAQGRILPPLAAADPRKAGVFTVPNRKVEAVMQSRHGLLWIGGADGLARIGADGVVSVVPLPAPAGATPEVSRLMQDTDGRIWAGTRHHGAFVVDPATGQAHVVPTPPGLAVQDGGLEIMAMEEVQPGRIWLGTFGQGIIDVDTNRLVARGLVRDPFVPGTLESNLVYALHRDRSGITWISTTGGLEQYVPPQGGIHTLFGSPARQGGLPTDVTAILAMPDNSVWLGSQTNGIVILGGDGKTVRTIPIPRVFCLASGADGAVYIGARGGLFVAAGAAGNFRKADIPPRRPTAGVFSLAVVDGVLWLGGGDEDGLWELHPATNGTFTVARHIAAPPLPDATIHSLALAPDGRLAVGTEHGIGLLDRATGALQTITPDSSDPHGINSGQIESFLTDRRGRLWIGSDDSGIAVMLGRGLTGKPVFAHITTADGLPDADIDYMATDATGRVWVSTDGGLAVIDSQTFAVRALTDADGVAISAYWNGSGGRTRQGDMLFGGLGGMTVVWPDSVTAWQYQPPLAVSEIHVGGKLVRARGAPLVIAPAANSLAVEFAALDFSAPNRNQYRYKLEGFDTDFIITDARHRVASYTNLPPGQYRLILQGSNRNGVWTAPATLDIKVLPAWFQTLYFRVAEIAALLLAGGAAVQGRTVWLRQRQLYLEQLVRNRTSALESSQQKLTQLAYFDTLTSLPNRRSFNETLEALLDAGRRAPHEFVLILIDLDGFKQVNDMLGHDAGDAVLSIAAARLRAAVREGDFIARLGGDEFAIVLRQVADGDIVAMVCDRVVGGMTAPLEVKGQPARIGASVGAALSPRHGRTAEELYKHADQALYQAKRAGKGVWRWYDAAQLERA